MNCEISMQISIFVCLEMLKNYNLLNVFLISIHLQFHTILIQCHPKNYFISLSPRFQRKIPTNAYIKHEWPLNVSRRNAFKSVKDSKLIGWTLTISNTIWWCATWIQSPLLFNMFWNFPQYKWNCPMDKYLLMLCL